MGTAVITVCQALSDKVRAQYPRANIHQIEDIPILSEKPTAKRGHEKLKTAFSLGDSHRVVYTGNLEAYQGIDLLIQSHQRLMTMDLKRNDCKLIIVGGSPAQIEHYKRKYDDDKIKKGSIIWVGQRPSQEMALWMELSHVLVSPRSEGENTPLKIYTYMSSGRPIVATRRLTHLQVLNDSVVFLAEPDPESFSAAIYAALHDKESSLQKAKNAKKLVEDHYSFRVFRKKLLEAYSFVERSSGRML
jgi:glycosyltransferase involved in cell wall biosynthesis